MLMLRNFTGHNLKNGETPGILVTQSGKTLAELGWPTPKVSWTIGNVYILKLLIPYRDRKGNISYNTTVLGQTLGAITIHSGGCATMATKDNKTYVCYSGFNEDKIVNDQERKKCKPWIFGRSCKTGNG